MTISELVWNIILSMFIGGVLYALDESFGAPFYRWSYNWWHNKQLTSADHVGFIMGQKTKGRTYTAIGIFVLWLVLTAIFSHVSINEIAWGIIVVPSMVIGFIAGPMFSRIFAWFPTLFGAVDELEQDPHKVAKSVWASFVEAVRGKPVPEPAPAPAPAPQAAATAKPAEDPLAAAARPAANGHDPDAPPALAGGSPPVLTEEEQRIQDFEKFTKN